MIATRLHENFTKQKAKNFVMLKIHINYNKMEGFSFIK